MHGFTLAQEHEVAQADAAGGRREGLLGDGSRTHARQVRLGHVRILLVELLRNDDREHRVTQEFQAFIVRDSSGLVRVGAVHERELQQGSIDARAPRLHERVGVGARRDGKVL